jgi:hypothetical protein
MARAATAVAAILEYVLPASAKDDAGEEYRQALEGVVIVSVNSAPSPRTTSIAPMQPHAGPQH